MFDSECLNALLAARAQMGLCQLDWDMSLAQTRLKEAKEAYVRAESELLRLTSRRWQVDKRDRVAIHELDQLIDIVTARRQECLSAIEAAQGVLTSQERIRELELNVSPQDVTKGLRVLLGVVERWNGERQDPDFWT